MPWFRHELMRRVVWPVGMALGLTGVISLAGCTGKDKSASADASQIVAKVNGNEISIHQVQSLLQSKPALAEQLGEAAPARVLDSLIEQELAAQAARQAGLDSSPRVLQSLELAKREVLARAYQDQLADKVVMPDTEALNRYFEAHPELFVQRRRYSLQETVVKATPEQARELKTKVESLPSVDAVNALVGASGLPHSSQNTVQWAEGLPMDILPSLAYLKNGQSLGVARPDGLVILTVLQVQDAPLTFSQASRAIQAALLATSRREAVQRGMDALRKNAKIQRMGPLAGASAASAPGSAPSAP